MPRLGKKAKVEWSIFIGSNGRRQYNILCRRCQHGCKQSFRTIILACPMYRSKRENLCVKGADLSEKTACTKRQDRR